MRILITGGAGFVGSSLALMLKDKYPSYEIVCFDNLKRRGSELNIVRLQERNIQFVHGDIRVPKDLDAVGEITHLIDACAEPSVLAGLDSDPSYLIHTNLNGTLHCLDYAKRWNAIFVFLSTSRVYSIDPLTQLDFEETETRFELREEQKIKGASQRGISELFSVDTFRSLYGSTKLASEMFVQEYHQFMNLRMVINRCGVLAGPWQFGKVDQGFMVLWVAHHYFQKSLGYFGFGGTGKQVRDVLHIQDLFALIDLQMHDISKFNGQTYNVGGGRNNSVSLCELTQLCQNVTGNAISIKSVPENRVADIPVYLTDNHKINTLSDWLPVVSTEKLVSDVFFWIQENEQMLKKIL